MLPLLMVTSLSVAVPLFCMVLMVTPLSVAVPLFCITPPPEVVSVPPVIVLPSVSTSEPAPTD